VAAGAVAQARKQVAVMHHASANARCRRCRQSDLAGLHED